MSGHGGTGIRPLEADLVLDLRFNEGIGLIAYDVSGYRNHGTLVGPPTWVDGKTGFGKALEFDGDNDYVNVLHSASLNITNITIISLIKIPSYTAHVERIISKNRSSAWMYGLYQNNGRPCLWGKFGGVAQMPYPSTTSVPFDTWTKIGVTYDGSIIRYYLNGLPDTTSTPSPAGDLDINAVDIKIGNSPTLTYDFLGVIDEIRVWNRALSAEKMALDYTQRGRR